MKLALWQELKNCHDCDAKPSELHKGSCDVERCPLCGGQRISCDCQNEDEPSGVWTGIWPGFEEAAQFGYYCKWTSSGWQTCMKDDPQAQPDLNTLYVAAEAGHITWDRKKQRFV